MTPEEEKELKMFLMYDSRGVINLHEIHEQHEAKKISDEVYELVYGSIGKFHSEGYARPGMKDYSGLSILQDKGKQRKKFLIHKEKEEKLTNKESDEDKIIDKQIKKNALSKFELDKKAIKISRGSLTIVIAVGLTTIAVNLYTLSDKIEQNTRLNTLEQADSLKQITLDSLGAELNQVKKDYKNAKTSPDSLQK